MTRLPVGEPDQTSIQEPDGSLEALAAATDPTAVAEVAARHPTCLAAWATLGELALRGDGQVPWSSEGNRGLLGSLAGLARAATAIAEQDEADRCRKFLKDLAPDAPQPT